MNGFTRHGIGHVSASSLAKFRNAPDVYVAHYIFGRRAPPSSATERGHAVERAVVDALCNGTTAKEATAKAIAKYDAAMRPLSDAKVGVERANIGGMAEQALGALANYGVPKMPDEGQEKIEIKIEITGDGQSIPLVGFLDLPFPQIGICVDLKSTTRIPNTMSPDHQAQRVIYTRATNYDMKFLYVSTKRSLFLADGDPATIFRDVETTTRRLERFLASGDAETLRATVPVNPHSFYWRGLEGVRRELYGI